MTSACRDTSKGTSAGFGKPGKGEECPSGAREVFVAERRRRDHSEDHRGTPEAPGRVVTLIAREHYDTLTDHHFSARDERVWGAAYHIPAPHVAEVKAYLDIREINGYSIEYAAFAPASSSSSSSSSSTGMTKPIRCLVYIGLPNNPQFVGPQDPQELARHILRSKGPSGQNREYLYNLERALASLSPESGDGHVSDLASRCRALEAEGGWEVETGAELAPLHRVGSTEEQEEVEKIG
ncbi:hypothetical protein, variant [Verruconis gallopava]|uniref:glutathione-specific gamma-glutamylcyclotransferase n=1 Tax=Verruconis gallopava TaxID=253628 RepID=A0A0D2APG6_9PEZI|nr:hypothetical protein, variant [Verruconis gallopava]KIW01004.1 hypothetical protein, variant [Verruconis gallopava]